MHWIAPIGMLIIFIVVHIYFECFVKKEKVKNVERGIFIYLTVCSGLLAGTLFILVTTSY